MARNEEKAQSMLYRFREAQAAELGLGTRGDKRPRMASACNSLRECERWRGEILREISRKVSKIQDAGLSDYEIRDLNDEINKLMREKRHWENQIVALGGANYRRNVAMLDDDGREVPGTKGYKYFGRAKDLPGVKELFESKKKEEEEENATVSHYKKFLNQGPSYFGDLDEDGEGERLINEEIEEEQNEWEEACNNVKGALGLPFDSSSPPYPGKKNMSISKIVADKLKPPDANGGEAKRKAPSSDAGDDAEGGDDEPSKRAKTSDVTSSTSPTIAVQEQAARAAAAFIPFFKPEDLMPPALPSREEMEGILLELRKRQLLGEYFGDVEAEIK